MAKSKTKATNDSSTDSMAATLPDTLPETKSTKKAKKEPAKRLGALAAAVQVLQQMGTAMSIGELLQAMKEQRLWVSPNGKTPHATLHAAISNEIRNKKEQARFRKVERGRFTLA